jgi:hypothetical protein
MTALARLIAAASLAALAAATSGCVRSKAVVTSDPPGADIRMNDIHFGTTPLEIPFTWYWYYDFQAELDGHETLVQRERFRPPPYLAFPLDFVMEAVPFVVRDTKEVHLVLTPADTRPIPEVAGQ